MPYHRIALFFALGDKMASSNGYNRDKGKLQKQGPKFSTKRAADRMKKGISAKKSVDAYTKAVELGVDNQMLGVSNAARIRRAAKKTGDSKSTVYDTQGRFEHFKKKKKRKK